MSRLIHPNPWQELKRYTTARIALGRTGVSLPTDALLQFGLAHAQARDAVHQPLQSQQLMESLHQLGLPVLQVHSAASNRDEYLRRPDLGRRLNSESLASLQAQPVQEYDLAILIGDGLSSTALHQNTLPFLQALHPHLRRLQISIAPIVVAEQARVALGDEVGQALRSRAVLVMIGERPGLTSPDSMGLYLTWQPEVGRLDSERNCISNVRPAGLAFAPAAHKLAWLLEQAFVRRLTGVGLKDESEQPQQALVHQVATAIDMS